MQVIDLSHPVGTAMQVFPGDPEVSLRPAATVGPDGFEVTELHLGSHTGTHIDAPRHTVPGGGAVDELPLEWLIAPARIVRVKDPQPRGLIRLAEVSNQLRGLAPGTMVLFETGFSRRFGTPEYLVHPVLAPEIADYLVSAGVRVTGVDTLNPDPTPEAGAEGPADLPFHTVFLGAGGAIIENLTNLAAVPWPEPMVSALPLRLAGVDGSPVRAVAFAP